MSDIVIYEDNENNSSFLNINKLETLKSHTEECEKQISKQRKKRDQLKVVQKYFTFENTFSTKGVQGITGILKVNNSSIDKEEKKIVFKVSLDLNASVEHEHLITKELNKLRSFCPHFVGNIGMLNIPISNDFINKPDQTSLFNNSNDYFPCNILLMEYVSPISLYRVCKHLNEDKSLIISLVLQSLLALDIAQQECKLTHYDSHLDNILVRKIEENTMFLYLHKGLKFLVPTFGMYPVFIDLGNAYVSAIEGKPMYTNFENYHNGLQSTLYDNINDVHHLLTSIFYYLEDEGYVYDFLRVRFMYLFKNIPMLAHKGWKQLPFNIDKEVRKVIKMEYPNIKKDFEVYKDYSKEIIELLNVLIILPWSNSENLSFSPTKETKDNLWFKFLTEINKIKNMKTAGGEFDVLYILREIINLINKYRVDFKSDPNSWDLTNFIAEWKKNIFFIVNFNMKEIPKDLDFKTLIDTSLKISDILSANYYNLVKKHVEICNDAYLKTPITCPLDAAMLILQNATPKYTINKQTKVYIWDVENKNKSIKTCSSLTDEQIDNIEKEYTKNKGSLLYNYLFKI